MIRFAIANFAITSPHTRNLLLQTTLIIEYYKNTVPQVSKRPIKPEVEKRMYEVFEEALASLENKEDIRNFINDLLTPTEKIMLAKRLSIAVLLRKGYPYREIARILKVSANTISRVIKKQFIGGEGYQTAVNQILEKESLNEFYLNLEEAFAKLVSPHPVSKKNVKSAYRNKRKKLQRKQAI